MRHLLLFALLAVVTAAEEPSAAITPAEPPSPQAYLGIAIDSAATTFEGHGLVVLTCTRCLAHDHNLGLDGTATHEADVLGRLEERAQRARRVADLVDHRAH